MIRFLTSFAIFLFAWLPMFIISLPVTFLLLLTSWDGKSTWFGNFKYGRGETHYKFQATTFWRQWFFLCIRNPVSNFGKLVLSVKDEPWVWLHDYQIIGRLHCKFGWKNPSGETPGIRTFIFRPYVIKSEDAMLSASRPPNHET